MLQDLTWTPGQSNPSGIGSQIFMASAADVASVPAYDTTSAELVAGNITMVSGKKFVKIYSTQGKAKFGFESVGEKDAKLFKLTAELSYPDIDAASKKLAMEILNNNCILLIPTLTTERALPTYVMLGGHAYDTETDAKGTSGDTPGSSKGLSLTITTYDIVPGKVYKGTVAITGGTLNLATGVLTP